MGRRKGDKDRVPQGMISLSDLPRRIKEKSDLDVSYQKCYNAGIREGYLPLVKSSSGSRWLLPEERLNDVIQAFTIWNTSEPQIFQLEQAEKTMIPPFTEPTKTPKHRIPDDEIRQFYHSAAWSKIRYQALVRYGRKCMCCGQGPGNKVPINVDHIKPVRLYWGLRLRFDNLQILCGPCNRGKGNEYDHDWRPAK